MPLLPGFLQTVRAAAVAGLLTTVTVARKYSLGAGAAAVLVILVQVVILAQVVRAIPEVLVVEVQQVVNEEGEAAT